MKWVQRHKGVIVEVICYLFILLFVYAGTTKLLEDHLFYDNIRNSPILGGKTMASLGPLVGGMVKWLSGYAVIRLCSYENMTLNLEPFPTTGTLLRKVSRL